MALVHCPGCGAKVPDFLRCKKCSYPVQEALQAVCPHDEWRAITNVDGRPIMGCPSCYLDRQMTDEELSEYQAARSENWTEDQWWAYGRNLVARFRADPYGLTPMVRGEAQTVDQVMRQFERGESLLRTPGSKEEEEEVLLRFIRTARVLEEHSGFEAASSRSGCLIMAVCAVGGLAVCLLSWF